MDHKDSLDVLLYAFKAAPETGVIHDAKAGQCVEIWLPKTDMPGPVIVVGGSHEKGWTVVDPLGAVLYPKRVYREGTAPKPPVFKVPNVRQVHPSLTAHKIVSVQPMTAPHGKAFYMDFKYCRD